MLIATNLLAHSLKNSLAITNSIKTVSFSTFTQPLWMRMTPSLLSAPQKKKKKADPALVKLKADKKRKRIWRDCKRLMRMEKQMKPLDEIQIPYKIIDEREKYEREKKSIPVEVLEERADLLRVWTAYKTQQHAQDLQLIDRIEYTQHKALEELLKESRELYEKAIQIDESFLPFTAKGTTQTPPIKDYFNPDGEYIDTTKKWEAPKLPDKKELKKLGITIVQERNDEWKEKKKKKKKKDD